MIMLTIGIIGIIAVLGLLIWNISRTPTNLKGYYGKGYSVLSGIALLLCVALIIFSLL